ncbi:MAG: hypothetical protein WD826_08275 [Actinomycetota bacterium]
MDVAAQLTSPVLIVLMTLVLNYVIKDRARETERLFDAKLDTVKAEIAGLRAEVIGIDGRMSAVEGRMSALQSELAAVRSDITSIALAVGAPPTRRTS